MHISHDQLSPFTETPNPVNISLTSLCNLGKPCPTSPHLSLSLSPLFSLYQSPNPDFSLRRPPPLPFALSAVPLTQRLVTICALSGTSHIIFFFFLICALFLKQICHNKTNQHHPRTPWLNKMWRNNQTHFYNPKTLSRAHSSVHPGNWSITKPIINPTTKPGLKQPAEPSCYFPFKCSIIWSKLPIPSSFGLNQAEQ